MIRKSNNQPTEQRGTWLLTFSDMITLLLTFFVLILSMSNIETSKVKGVAGSVIKVLGMNPEMEGKRTNVIESVIPSLCDEDIESERIRKDKKNVSGAFTDRRETFSKAIENLGGQKIVPHRNGFSLSLNEQLMFFPGSAEISIKGRNTLYSLGEILKRSDVSIRVEGNTDNIPISKGKYQSNWELSLARAVNVVKYMISDGGIAPERLSAVGYADTRPRVSNDNMQNRQLNRRVDVYFTFSEI
jgi:chemotaxis protein MotB